MSPASAEEFIGSFVFAGHAYKNASGKIRVRALLEIKTMPTEVVLMKFRAQIRKMESEYFREYNATS